MNVETGDLYKDLEAAKAEKAELRELRQVPEHHAKEAFKELNGKDHVKVDISKKTPLTRWAKRESHAIHKTDKRKARRKISDASKKRNRRA